ncbi:MAG TPA: type III pantothenate kinase, partial [Gammaproteobacteria bacterium]|nr:type III pantothenate kinase [Gammaproteobacteria bacterium]
HVTPWFAHSRAAACGVRSAYMQPHTLGVDRWAAIVAGFRRGRASAPGEPVCVVDAGTALTIDAISASGEHQGGLILPGLRLLREALLAAAADIDSTTQEPSAAPPGFSVFARSTEQALANSGSLACAAAVDRCARTLSAQGGAPYVVLCGGDAAALAPWLETRAQICPNLVFEGLAMLFEQRMCE